MHRKVLDPLLKMLSSTLLCRKLKLPVMTLLEAEASAQTGSRSVRTSALPREISQSIWLLLRRDPEGFPSCPL